MRKTKKIIGLLLAVVMIFSAMSTVAFAAVPDGKVIRYVVTPDKASYSAGETAVFTVSAEILEGANTIDSTAQIDIGYNSACFAPVADVSSAVLFGDYGVDYSKGAFANYIDPTDSDVIDNSADANFGGSEGNLPMYDWDASMNFRVSPSDFSSFELNGETVLFTFPMTVKKDLAADSFTVAVNLGAIEMGATYLTIYVDDYADAPYMPEFNVSEVGKLAAAPEVVLAGTMARMDNWADADATVFDGGLMGQINNLPLVFDGKECTTIKSIEVFLNGEEEASANAYQVYKVDDTTYKFRAVIKNMDKASANYATEFSYKFVVTLDTGDTLEVEGTTSAKAIYETAKANYDASIA